MLLLRFKVHMPPNNQLASTSTQPPHSLSLLPSVVGWSLAHQRSTFDIAALRYCTVHSGSCQGSQTKYACANFPQDCQWGRNELACHRSYRFPRQRCGIDQRHRTTAVGANRRREIMCTVISALFRNADMPVTFKMSFFCFEVRVPPGIRRTGFCANTSACVDLKARWQVNFMLWNILSRSSLLSWH
jgi:hypothetical protein